METNKIYLKCLNKDNTACIVYTGNNLDVISKILNICKSIVGHIVEKSDSDKFLITDKNPIFQKVYKEDMSLYSFVNKKYVKDYLLTMSGEKLMDYLRYKLRIGLKWRLAKHINNPCHYYGQIITHIVADINDDELIFGLDKNFNSSLLENENILNILIDLLESFTTYIIKKE